MVGNAHVWPPAAISAASLRSLTGTGTALSAVVPFYGIPPSVSKVDYSKIRAPILAHFASRDAWAKPEAAEAVKRELEGRGQSMELHVYDADHAFVNDTRSDVYNVESATLAWQRTVDFLHKHLD